MKFVKAVKRWNNVFIAVMGAHILVSCSTHGDPFFIRNFEDHPVRIEYKYVEPDQKAGPDTLYFPQKGYWLAHQGILDDKELFRIFREDAQVDTLILKQFDSWSYAVQLPPTASVYVPPLYRYGNSLEYLVMNQNDTIHFKDRHPYIAMEELHDRKLFRQKGAFWAEQQYILDLKIKEIRKVMSQKNLH